MRRLGRNEMAIQNRRKEHVAFADARRRSASLVQLRDSEAGFRRGRYEATWRFRRRRRHRRSLNRAVSTRRSEYHHRSAIATHRPFSLSRFPFPLGFSSRPTCSPLFFFILPATISNSLSRSLALSRRLRFYKQLGRRSAVTLYRGGLARKS